MNHLFGSFCLNVFLFFLHPPNALFMNCKRPLSLVSVWSLELLRPFGFPHVLYHVLTHADPCTCAAGLTEDGTSTAVVLEAGGPVHLTLYIICIASHVITSLVFTKWRQNLDLRCVLLPARVGAGGPAQNTCVCGLVPGAPPKTRAPVVWCRGSHPKHARLWFGAGPGVLPKARLECRISHQNTGSAPWR